MSRAAKGADCKSAGLAFVGSSPTSPTNHLRFGEPKNRASPWLSQPISSLADAYHSVDFRFSRLSRCCSCIAALAIVQVHNFVDRPPIGGGSGCETTASTGLSPLLTSLLSHCSHGGNSFTAETFVNDGLSGHRRKRRPLSRSSLTKVSAVKHAPPCETMDHTRPFQLSLISRWRGPRLLPENRPGRMLLKLLSPILHILSEARSTKL